MTTTTAPVGQVAALLARRVMRAAPVEGLTTKQLRQAAGRYKPILAEALAHAVDRQWLDATPFVSRTRQAGTRYTPGARSADIPPAHDASPPPQKSPERKQTMIDNFTPAPFPVSVRVAGYWCTVIGWSVTPSGLRPVIVSPERGGCFPRVLDEPAPYGGPHVSLDVTMTDSVSVIVVEKD